MRRFLCLGFLAALVGLVPLELQAQGMPPVQVSQKGKGSYSLTFDPTAFVAKSATVNGQAISYRAYEGIVYVQNPVDIVYQSMNVYVPTAYYEGKTLGGYSAATAPIFFPNSVGGYMPGAPGTPGTAMDGSGPNAILVALSKGYVVAAPGARGRTNKDAAGTFVGKAPACIVDLKAAVRYLRLNDKAMPGTAEKIISNGTSAGGGLSALLAATGNSPDYEPFLTALGAAKARDDVYAASCYCPITNLDNADAAYEWLFNGINDYSAMVISASLDYHVQRTEVKGTISPDQIRLSNGLAAFFPAYLNALGLKKADGSLLGLDAKGTGSFRDYVKSFVVAAAQKAQAEGKDLSSLGWLSFKDGKVVDLDFDAYLRYAMRMKLPPAFDGVDLSRGENDLFGTPTVAAQHFTSYAMANSTVASTRADPAIVKLMNPLGYIGAKGVTTAKYWRIRHGTKDRDTSLAVPVILATRLQNAGYNVDFALPWDRPHSGDYDLDELFAWIAQVSR